MENASCRWYSSISFDAPYFRFSTLYCFWDFAVTTAVEGWHSTIFAPYFVIGAVHSGVSAVVTMMALMRWGWGWNDFIRPEHFDALARLLTVVATAWLGSHSLNFCLPFTVLMHQK